MPQKNRSPGTGKTVHGAKLDSLQRSKHISPSHKKQISDDLPEIRAMWWRLRSRGVALPAEPGVILIDDGWSR